jgi:predicted transcriptional regulator
MPTKRKTYDTMTEALREAIAESELSFKALERETGVLRQSLMKFAAGEQSLRLDAADKLAKFFELQLVRTTSTLKPQKQGK